MFGQCDESLIVILLPFPNSVLISDYQCIHTSQFSVQVVQFNSIILRNCITPAPSGSKGSNFDVDKFLLLSLSIRE